MFFELLAKDPFPGFVTLEPQSVVQPAQERSPFLHLLRRPVLVP